MRNMRMEIFMGLIWILTAFSITEQTCPIKVEKVNCSEKDDTYLIYTCLSSFDGSSCSCVFENPLTSELGWFKMCRTKNASKLLHKKKVRKRQLTNVELCGGIQPPKPGRASCSLSPTGINCIGTCDAGYRFIDGASEHVHLCLYSEGVWKPSSTFPLCEPFCDPPCQNGGSCVSHNICSCTNEYRGEVCQYPISLCDISKNRQPSNWQCNHTATDTTCDISCHAPDTLQASTEIYRHVCSIEGLWSPPLPSCVQVLQCRELKPITNGRWLLVIGQNFISGSKAIYSCDAGFYLRGESQLICESNGTWSKEPPQCIQEPGYLRCEDPGEIHFSRRIIPLNGLTVGSSIRYECNERFLLLGDAKIICQKNGQWSSVKPQCIPKESIPDHCSKPNAPKNSIAHVNFPDQQPLQVFLNANMSLSQRLRVINIIRKQGGDFSDIPEGMFLVGTRVQYKCKSRFYKLYGSEYQTCLSSRIWSGYQPACIPDCGKSDSPRTPFIINGNSSEIGQWPWQVGIALRRHEGLELICGGALISELWVLTAAHCVTKKLSNIPIAPNEVLIFCGKYYRSFQRDDSYVQVRKVQKIVVHDEYDFIHYDGDIALLQLEEAVEFTTRVKPICLPNELTTRENVRDGKKGIVTGWGLTESGKFSETLKEAVLPVVSHDRCEKAYREGLRTVTITENMFCAGYETGTSDTCNGDSGGPFMFSFGSANDNHWYLEGLVSWGSESGCGKSYRYSGFTKVSRFVPWIKMLI